MLEIIFIIMLSRRIGEIVKKKGLKPAKYVTIMIILWIVLEVTGSVIGGLFFEGPAIYLFAIIGAAIGGYSGFSIANNARANYPDFSEVLDSDVIDN